ncbi:hypothetical protein [Chthonobacter albigriseus]|uniref:hypothetical protein n=1 Tax=Chthonobacter albigriseus TaxID=1683161 RepID=UPI0015EE9CEF|nr:hypothetical protein [Chthonobacter albigriseus]
MNQFSAVVAAGFALQLIFAACWLLLINANPAVWTKWLLLGAFAAASGTTLYKVGGDDDAGMAACVSGALAFIGSTVVLALGFLAYPGLAKDVVAFSFGHLVHAAKLFGLMFAGYLIVACSTRLAVHLARCL